jgi:general nucleoside transport system permease protein
MNFRSPWLIGAFVLALVLIVLAIVAPTSAIVVAAAVLIPGTLRFTTPLLFAALGGLFSERSGIVNIALEGIMLFGALAAAVIAQQVEAPFLKSDPNAILWWVPWVGVLGAMVVGGFVAWIHALASIKYRADQVISGTAINLLATGVPAVILQYFYNNTSDSASVKNVLPLWGIGEVKFSPLVYIAFLIVPVVSYVLYRTPFGLRLRSVGEAPQAAASVGVNVMRMRYTAVILSGVLAGLAGAYLSIGNLDKFNRGMSANQGFIALAALIFGKWLPWNTMGACLLFGFFTALKIVLGGGDLLPPAIVEMMPFVLTILVLAGFIGRSRAPKAIGKPYP